MATIHTLPTRDERKRNEVLAIIDAELSRQGAHEEMRLHVHGALRDVLATHCRGVDIPLDGPEGSEDAMREAVSLAIKHCGRSIDGLIVEIVCREIDLYNFRS